MKLAALRSQKDVMTRNQKPQAYSSWPEGLWRERSERGKLVVARPVSPSLGQYSVNRNIRHVHKSLSDLIHVDLHTLTGSITECCVFLGTTIFLFLCIGIQNNDVCLIISGISDLMKCGKLRAKVKRGSLLSFPLEALGGQSLIAHPQQPRMATAK